jgi:hypothetical protein
MMKLARLAGSRENYPSAVVRPDRSLASAATRPDGLTTGADARVDNRLQKPGRFGDRHAEHATPGGLRKSGAEFSGTQLPAPAGGQTASVGADSAQLPFDSVKT